jgi:hypothetical protein
MSLATQSSLMLVSSSALCSRLASRWRSAICVFAIARQLTQLADRLGRHKVGFQQPGLGQLAQPRGVREIGLAPGHLLDMPGVDEHQLEVVLEDVPDRLPIHTGGLHHHLRHAVSGQPVTQRQQATDRGRELGQVRLAHSASRGHPHARRHLSLVDIKRRRALDDHLHHDPLAGPRCRLRGPRKTTSLKSVLDKQQSGSPDETPTPN